jgi:hypothetical protein
MFIGGFRGIDFGLAPCYDVATTSSFIAHSGSSNILMFLAK